MDDDWILQMEFMGLGHDAPKDNRTQRLRTLAQAFILNREQNVGELREFIAFLHKSCPQDMDLLLKGRNTRTMPVNECGELILEINSLLGSVDASIVIMTRFPPPDDASLYLSLRKNDDWYAKIALLNPKLVSDITNVNLTRAHGEELTYPTCVRELLCTSVVFIALVPSDTIKNGVSIRGEVYASALRSYVKEADIKGNVSVLRAFDLYARPTYASTKESIRDLQLFDAAASLIENAPLLKKSYGAMNPEPEFGVVVLKFSGFRPVQEICRFWADMEEKMRRWCLHILEIQIDADFSVAFDPVRLASGLNKACDLQENRQLDRAFGELGNFEKLERLANVSRTQTDCVLLDMLDSGITTPIRSKIYNKFAASLENRSANKAMGLSLDRWMESRKGTMYEAASHALESGLTCVEMVFVYSGIPGESIEEKAIESAHQSLVDRVFSIKEVFYECPISAQWHELSCALTDNLVILDWDVGSAALVWWCNSKNKRVGGISFKLTDPQRNSTPNKDGKPSNRDLCTAWIVGNYSFRRGTTHVLELEGDEITLRSFVKSRDNIEKKTYLPGGSSYDAGLWYPGARRNEGVREKPIYISPAECGLVAQSNIELASFMTKVTVKNHLTEDFVETDSDIEHLLLYDEIKISAIDDFDTFSDLTSNLELCSVSSVDHAFEDPFYDPRIGEPLEVESLVIEGKRRTTWKGLAKLDTLPSRLALSSNINWFNIQNIRPHPYNNTTRYILTIHGVEYGSNDILDDKLNGTWAGKDAGQTFATLRNDLTKNRGLVAFFDTKLCYVGVLGKKLSK